MVGYAGWAGAAFAVAGHRKINELRIVEIQAIHQHDEIFQRAVTAQSRVACLFLADCADTALLVIVCWIHQGVVVMGEQLTAYRMIERAWVATLKIGASAGVDQQRVARIQSTRMVVGEMIVGVAGGMDRAQFN